MLGAIEYFDENYDQFSEEAQKAFADKVSYEVSDRGNKYSVANFSSSVEEPIPRRIRFVNSLYENIYDLESNTLNLNYIEDTSIKEAIKDIKNDDVFIMTKAYYIEEVFEDFGFEVVIHPDTYHKLKKCLDITYVELENSMGYETQEGESVCGLDGFHKPIEVLKASDVKWDDKYPSVYLESPENLDLLEGSWKTVAYIPVKIIDEKQPDKEDAPVFSDDKTLIESNGTNYYKYKTNTTVHFDIDQDGTDEEIIYDTENGKLKIAGYEDVDTNEVMDWKPYLADKGYIAEKDYFIIIKFNDKFMDDYIMNMIGIIFKGPDGNSITTLYSIIAPMGENWFGKVGQIPGEIVIPSNFDEENMDDFNCKAVLYEKRGVEAPVRLSIIDNLQTWFGRNDFTYYSTYCSLIDNIHKYEQDYITKVELRIEKDVTAYNEKDLSSDNLTIKGGQKVYFIATDNNEWIKILAEDETMGWVNVKDVTESNFSGFIISD